MDTIFKDFREAYVARNGYDLATTLRPDLGNDTLRQIWRISHHQDVNQDIKSIIRRGLGSGLLRLEKDELQGWVDVYKAYWDVVTEILAVQDNALARGKSAQSSWSDVYTSWRELCSTLIRGYNNHGFQAWTVPCLYVAGKFLRAFAIKADQERNSSSGETYANSANFADDFDPELEKHQQLEDAARQLNRILNTCLSDRAELNESRKWAIYYTSNLLFKTYFKLNQAGLCKNILRALSAGRGDMPELSAVPKAQQVTFKYYEGVLAFLEEDYVAAEKYLTEAWVLCHRDAKRNKELILTYLIPCHLLTTHTLPSSKLLAPFPRLQALFGPLSQCIKKGQLHKFDLALEEGEDEFVKRRIYLTLERGRDIALRNLLRKVFLAGGFEEQQNVHEKPIRRTRIPVAEFRAAINLGSGETLDVDEVECFLANMIYKNLMKGYIARDRGMVVLSKAGAFPGTGV